jgi:ABC-type lipoprotein export system ATPase subunit
MAEWLLRARGLRRTFGAVGVVQADLALQCGERVAVLGRSGSGKSTLMAMLAGLCRPEAGRVDLALDQSVDLWSLSTAERCRLRRGPVGFISQFTSLLPALTTLDNLLLPAVLAGRLGAAERLASARHWLDAVELGHRCDVPAGQLSGGEQRRAIVARALMNRPRLLLADEPTSNLDGVSEEAVFSLLRELCHSSNIALLMVTHSEQLARRCDRCLRLEAGVLAGGPDPAAASQAPPASSEGGASDAAADPVRRRLLLAGLLAGACALAAGSLRIRQRHGEAARAARRRTALQGLAFRGLSAELTLVERLGGGAYSGTIAVENLDPLLPLFLLPLDVQLYVQQGSRWNPFPAAWSRTSRGVSQLAAPGQLTFTFADLPASHTELVPGYLHVRIDATYAVADRPDPDQAPVERRDSFFIHLLPPHPDPERIARNGFPGEVPLFIPMPPH